MPFLFWLPYIIMSGLFEMAAPRGTDAQPAREPDPNLRTRTGL